jgi:hypothetical protein
MKIFVPTVIAAAFTVGFIAVKAERPPSISASFAASLPLPGRAEGTAERYRLQAPGDLSCFVAKGALARDGGHTLLAEPKCERLLPGLAQARHWLERQDGSITFSRDGQDELVTFAAGDGVAYESYQPASALIALIAED